MMREPPPAPGVEETMTGKAYAVLEEMIVTLQLPPGEVLSESGLTRLLNIGRTPIREALQRLAIEGLVVILPRRGILVSDINVSSQLELLRLRREVERLMARLAAARATPAQREAFVTLNHDMLHSAELEDDIAFMRQDTEFNTLLAQACGNEYARRAMSLMAGLSRRFWYQHYRQALDLPRCARLHAAVAAAIGAGDADAAGAANDRLIDYTEDFTRATLESGVNRSAPAGR